MAALLLQFINIPYLFKSYNIIEKYLILISRVTESDCIVETEKFLKYIKKLK